jgi:hypothetical protein
MNRDPNIIPKPIVNAMQNFSDKKFVSYVCKNHIRLFSNEILEVEVSELKKYIDSLFSNFGIESNQTTNLDIVNKFPDLNNILVVVEKETDYLAAIKEVLWQFKNTPSTAKKILMHIAKIDSNGVYSLVCEKDYQITNKTFSLSSFNRLLICTKIKTENGSNVYLYKNPTDKRQGFYYKGNLLSLKELSNINNVPIVTIQSRIKRGIKIEDAILR